jgi:hypothetical protein
MTLSTLWSIVSNPMMTHGMSGLAGAVVGWYVRRRYYPAVKAAIEQA